MRNKEKQKYFTEVDLENWGRFPTYLSLSVQCQSFLELKVSVLFHEFLAKNLKVRTYLDFSCQESYQDLTKTFQVLLCFLSRCFKFLFTGTDVPAMLGNMKNVLHTSDGNNIVTYSDNA